MLYNIIVHTHTHIVCSHLNRGNSKVNEYRFTPSTVTFIWTRLNKAKKAFHALMDRFTLLFIYIISYLTYSTYIQFNFFLKNIFVI